MKPARSQPKNWSGLKAISAKRGQALEWAFLLDSFQAERDQGVTIDVSRIRFATAARPYVVIDAPGHVEFLKNMVTGAADAEAALLMVDASEGLKEQTRRHAYLLRLLGVEQVAVVVTKMDLVGYDQQRFSEIARDVRAYLQELGADPQVIIPISAREGENIAAKSDKMAWHDGPTVLEALDTFTPRRPPAFMPLRLPVQDVYKFDERRIIAGTIAAGQLRQGDTLLFSPSGKTARVESIETWSAPEKLEAKVGEAIGVTLDRQIFVERGELASHIEEAPVLTNVFRGRVFWLDDQPLKVGDAVKLRINSMDAEARVQAIERVIDTESSGGRRRCCCEPQRSRRNRPPHPLYVGAGRSPGEPGDGAFRHQPQFPHCRRRRHFHGRLPRSARSHHRALHQHHGQRE